MVSCIETGSLIFAVLGLLGTFIGSVTYCVFIVRLFILMVNLTTKVKTVDNIEVWLTSYGLHSSILLTMMLSILVIGLVFSIILLTGLLKKKSHLVKAYFVFGVTGNTIAILFGIYVTQLLVKTGLLILLGCFVYSFILVMIKKTYLELQINEHKKKGEKQVVEEKSISIKL